LAKLLPRLGRSYRGLGADLTRREREVLNLLADGRSNPAIAAHLVISVHTVRNHVQNVLAKLGAHSKLEAVAVAAREGLLDAKR
jgi:DNA-binding NarL/FixJ family response regulator